MRNRTRITAIAGMAAAGVALLVSPALANWTQLNSSWSYEEESRRWDDGDYTQVQFTNCDNVWVSGSSFDSVDIQVWRVINNFPDDSYDLKTFTACYGGGTSSGAWSEIPTGTESYYFKIMDVGGVEHGGGPTAHVDKVYVDTTKAD
ncbi:hypothetical protein AB0F07_38745 [Streptomyces fructofermentans]|uniref:hypothetical protein n=1 Tax=Streptomyces fructofermentans TaxID=152141 RepID=UPI0033EE435B